MPYLSDKERLKIVDFMLDLSVRNDNIPEICTYLSQQFKHQ